jgi:hypothetical protein
VLEAMVTEMWVRGLSVCDVEEALRDATGAFAMSNSSVSQLIVDNEQTVNGDGVKGDIWIEGTAKKLCHHHGSRFSVANATGLLVAGDALDRLGRWSVDQRVSKGV